MAPTDLSSASATLVAPLDPGLGTLRAGDTATLHAPISAPQRSTVRFDRVALRLGGFIGLIVVLAYALDATITRGLRKAETSNFGSFNRVVAGAINADIVINGSSRALVHYDPRVIAATTGLSAYNLGLNGVQIDVQLAILRTYLRHNATPRIVVQNLEAFTFETTRAREIYDPGFFMPYLPEDELYDALCQIDPTVWKWRHVPLYGYAVEDLRFTWWFGILGHLGYRAPEDYFLGFNPRQLEWTDDFDRFRARAPNGIRYPIEPRGVATLTALLTLCRDQGIQAILVYSPEYVEMQALERNRAAIFAQFQEISARFGVPFWDFSDSPLSASREYFYNSQHLNARGAALFSAEFAKRLAQFQNETIGASADRRSRPW